MPVRNTQPRYNICPTTNIDAVIEHEGKRELSPMRWPHSVVVVQATQGNESRHVQCARGYRGGEARIPRRIQAHAMVPASGYYEWHDTPDGKQPYYFTRRDGEPVTIAGLWDSDC
jgi:putative SOS response-associated peptidase YedK